MSLFRRFMEELLHKAIENGDEARVRELIQLGAAMDKLMGFRGTALCAAISDHQTSIAFYLIDAGCDVNGEDFDREPPLLLAMRKECFNIVRRLVNHPKCNLNKADPLTKLTPLCFAAKFGQAEVVNLLIASGCQLKGKDADGNSALHLSIVGGYHEIVECLVQKGCSLTTLNNEGFTPVHTLARKGDYKILIKFLSRWIQIRETIPDNFTKLKIPQTVDSKMLEIVNITTKYTNETPLLIASREGHSNLIKMFLMCGADPNLADFLERDVNGEQIRNYRSTPLIRLCTSYKKGLVGLDIITWLLDAGCHVNIPALESGHRPVMTTPLAFAARHDLLDLARLLVLHGANVNLKSSENTPLYEAILNNSEHVMLYFFNECKDIQYLTASGVANRNYFHAAVSLPAKSMDTVVSKLVLNNCPVNWNDDTFQTPLLIGVEKHNIPFVRKILTLGGNVAMCNKDLDTPLHICVDKGSVEMTKILLVHGADVNVENSKKMSPLDIALEYCEDDDHKEIAILLLQNGSRVSSSSVAILMEEDESKEFVADGSDSDDSDTDSSVSSYSSDDSNINLHVILRDLVKKRLNNPISLSVLTVAVIRDHFRHNVLPFSGIASLPLPKSIIDLILLS